MASASSHQTSSSRWYEIVLRYYPEALSHTHTVPPVHFNRVPYTLVTVPGTTQLALRQRVWNAVGGFLRTIGSVVRRPPPSQPQLQPPQVLFAEEPQDQPVKVQDSDLWDDAAQARIVRNLEELGRHRQEAMFILSQFNVENYLSKPEYQGASSQLPLPSELDRPGKKFSHGEFDVLIIHRHRGILIGEVKSVGHNHADLKLNKAQSDAAVVKRLDKALRQLDRLKKVVRHVASDIAPSLNVRAAVFLPNVTRAQLQRVLAKNRQLKQDICQTLGATDAKKAVQLCCTADDVSARDTWWDILDPVLTKLTTWWNERMDTVDPAMSDQTYLDIVARFVGPASSVTVFSCTPPRVEIRTESEALAELGWRLSCLVLTPQQLDLTSRQLPLAYLTGPPGTGKTVVLVLRGVNWLQHGNDTCVVSTSLNALAISTMIVKQLETTATSAESPTTIGNVRLCHFDLINDSAAHVRAVRDLSAAARGGARIIMDEVDFDTSDDRGQRTYSLVQQLIRQVPNLHLWCAGMRHDTTPPTGLQAHVLTAPLRSAPAVLREVRPAFGMITRFVQDYTDDGVVAPGDGQRARHLRHEGITHTGRWPVSCEQCGADVAAELRQLGVGVPGSGVTYRDVFILTRSSDLQDEEKNDAGDVTSQACGVVRGLRGAGMPVCVIGYKEWRREKAKWKKEVQDMATAATDRITAAYRGYVFGLERKVVVWLHGREQGHDDGRSDEVIDASDRLALVTRCTTQLVVVDVPP